MHYCTKNWKKYNCSASYQAMPADIISMTSFKVSILHAKFSMIPCNRLKNTVVPRILGKKEKQSD